MLIFIGFGLSTVFGLFWGCEKPVPAPLCEVLGECQQEGLCEGVRSETLAQAPIASQVPTVTGSLRGKGVRLVPQTGDGAFH